MNSCSVPTNPTPLRLVEPNVDSDLKLAMIATEDVMDRSYLQDESEQLSEDENFERVNDGLSSDLSEGLCLKRS